MKIAIDSVLDSERIHHSEAQHPTASNNNPTSKGLFAMVLAAAKHSLKPWFWFVMGTAIVNGGILVACGHQFIVAASVDDRVFWGVWFLVSINAQVGLKQWLYLEMYRVSIYQRIDALERRFEQE